MVILGLNIAAFGKLSNKEIPLRPGTNVITGDNESGKTTIAVFLKSMLYGMEEGDNVYERYYPFGFSGVYGGSLTILSEDRVYELKRSFLKSNPDLSITCTEDGEALEDPEGWLEENRGGLSRAEYEASGYIAQNALTRDAQWLEETGRLNEEQKGVLCVIPRRKLYNATEMVLSIDPKAFITITQINEVRGQGFTLERKNIDPV